MPPLKMFPEAFRSGPHDSDYEELQARVRSAELKQINLGDESIFYADDFDLEAIMPAYTMETGKTTYITLGDEGYYSSEHRAVNKKGWLGRVLGRS